MANPRWQVSGSSGSWGEWPNLITVTPACNPTSPQWLRFSSGTYRVMNSELVSRGAGNHAPEPNRDCPGKPRLPGKAFAVRNLTDGKVPLAGGSNTASRGWLLSNPAPKGRQSLAQGLPWKRAPPPEEALEGRQNP
jgi:hypothetical protein